ncbi:MAG: hypothetical protein HON43_04390 [Alphaproteobacteria bacterium]|jgi:hypothetical protein|nr:hypothetical protein [Alphaproteobacteria bacterium]MBT5390246.1 hypothetical protein [Alphaproteobacteria bacterium]MBT5540742.1 hypothetical protein [Alphaproteobacteria bacterium]
MKKYLTILGSLLLMCIFMSDGASAEQKFVKRSEAIGVMNNKVGSYVKDAISKKHKDKVSVLILDKVMDKWSEQTRPAEDFLSTRPGMSFHFANGMWIHGTPYALLEALEVSLIIKHLKQLAERYLKQEERLLFLNTLLPVVTEDGLRAQFNRVAEQPAYACDISDSDVAEIRRRVKK